MAQDLFTPMGSTAAAACTTSSGSTRVAMPVTPSTVSYNVRVKNIDTTNVAYVAFGDSSVTAAVPAAGTPAAGIPIGPGETAGFTLGAQITHFAGITSTSTATLLVTCGMGL